MSSKLNICSPEDFRQSMPELAMEYVTLGLSNNTPGAKDRMERRFKVLNQMYRQVGMIETQNAIADANKLLEMVGVTT